jgi:hypothetical protein
VTIVDAAAEVARSLSARMAWEIAGDVVRGRLRRRFRDQWWRDYDPDEGPAVAEWQEARVTEEAVQAELLREIVGNPFRPITIEPRWRTANVLDLARTIDEEEAFDRMPILADALMDAGCDCEAVLSHCRRGEWHVRGCWVIRQLGDMVAPATPS